MPLVPTISAFIAGLLFGTGLILSGMTEPLKVQAFLDITGDWNPALALVMASAIAVAMPAFLWAKKQRKTTLGQALDVANKKPVDASLLLGSAIFGVGWGLSGICPGPGLVIAATGSGNALVFVAFMSIGILLRRAFVKKETCDVNSMAQS